MKYRPAGVRMVQAYDKTSLGSGETCRGAKLLEFSPDSFGALKKESLRSEAVDVHFQVLCLH